MPNQITIFQIDAHFDIRDTDADFKDKPFGKFSHACIMRRAYEMGFSLVQVGIRAYSKLEFEFAKNKKQINFFEWGIGKIPEVGEVISAIKTPRVYITIDVDGFDPTYMPATGTPVQGGLEWYYGIQLLKEIFRKKDVIGCDIVEVAPRLYDNLTEYGAAQLLYSMLGFKLVFSDK
jgi:agmatinase